MRTSRTRNRRGRGLVQEQNLRPLDQRERDGEASLVARGQAADDLAARARVLELLEPDGVEELVHRGALGDVEVSAVQPPWRTRGVPWR